MTTPTVHNPTHFEPADYEVLDYLDNKRPGYYGQPIEVFEADVKCWEADMLAALGAEWRSKIHRCVHCGNGNVRWITVVRHAPTSDRVVFGSDCTERLGFVNRQAWKLATLQAKAALGAAKLKVWKQREAFLVANPAFAAAVEQATQPAHAGNRFAQDVIGKLNAFGSLSERQVSAVIASLARDIETAARKAAEATTPKGPAPTGRQTVTGVVLSLKDQVGDYGVTRKMLLQLANGSRVWLTAPAKESIERGDTVTVTATFDVSKDDASFSFGKRPHLVSRVPAAGAVAA